VSERGLVHAQIVSDLSDPTTSPELSPIRTEKLIAFPRRSSFA